MKAHNLHPVWKRHFVHTTNSKHDLPVAQNVLNRDFKPAWPDRTWAADITYIQTQTGWLYLAAVLDLYSRKPLAGPCLPACLLIWFVTHSGWQSSSASQPPDCDRGSQYASQAHRE
jgi:hypothetical protein